MSPTSPTVLIGYHDIALIIIITLADYWMWKSRFLKKINWIIGIVWFLLFSYLIPLLSAKIELYNVFSTHHEDEIDSFNLWYIYFRWPTWWVIGLIELFVLIRIAKLVQRNN